MLDWLYIIGGILAVLLIAYVALRLLWRRARRALLMRRYDDAEMVASIMEKQIARGMTVDMVIDAWGVPADMDETVMKTKTKRQMKYDPKGRNRYGTRVYLENGAVVGWETK